MGTGVNLRSIEHIPSLDTSKTLRSEELELEIIDIEKPADFPELSYPFSGQDILKGRYTYRSSPTFGSPEESKGELELRTESGLAIVHTEGDRPRPRRIIQSLNEALGNDYKIEPFFSPPQEKAWEFVEKCMENGADIIDLTVITRSGDLKHADELDLDLKGLMKYPLDSVRLELSLDEETTELRYTSDRIEIKKDPSGKATEYITQIFETVFYG